MKGIALLAAAGCVLAAALAHSAEPIVTDSRVITEERRVQLLEAKLASLQRQVELLEDRRAIERLQQQWGHYVSEGMADAAAALFSKEPGASIEFAQQGIYRGRERIAAFLKLAAPVSRGVLRETPVMQPVIHIAADGRSARARWRSLVMAGQHGEDGRWEEGPYENEYVKEDGAWKISRLHWFTTVNGSFSKGWHRESWPVAGPLRELPPDAPPSIRYEAFPRFFLPPFHYYHPVTGKPVAWETPVPEGAP
jgi:hypothetical protein